MMSAYATGWDLPVYASPNTIKDVKITRDAIERTWMLKQLDRWSRWVNLLTLCIAPFLLYSLLRLPVGSASVHQWLPDGLAEKDRYLRFQKNFGDDQFLIASWEGCSIDDPRLDEFRTRLLSVPSNEPPKIDSVKTTKDVLEALMEPPMNLSLKKAKSRLQGILIGPDGTAATIVRFSPMWGLKIGTIVSMSTWMDFL